MIKRKQRYVSSLPGRSRTSRFPSIILELWGNLLAGHTYAMCRFPRCREKRISVLIGTNVQEAFIPLEVKVGNPNEPIAIKSCLGWSVLGRSCKSNLDECYHANLVVSEDYFRNGQLERFWSSENYGTERRDTKPTSVEDRRALKIIEETMSKSDNHYQIGLLWKDDEPHLPDNRTMAEARLQHLKKCFKRDPELKVKYSKVMEEYLIKGYAKELSNEEAATKSDITWYLPHHPVLNPNKPGKVRVVFDAAAKFAGVSLNDKLLQGPSAINDLTGVLLRFRQHEFAFTADIEAMFH
ncbi:hypothetical protein QZH41_006052 [Actinostola sp. cb2023]|nr:hypothetical protein QZH41_006052 [Actinostola sp. cb2023]